MELTKRVMSRSNWLCIKDREYVYMLSNDNNFNGAIGLLYLKNIIEPAIKIYEDTSVTIVDEGYYWLQFAPNNKNYWLTVMYNQRGEIVQFYFDITESNTILDNGESWFYDLYLDIVFLPDGKKFLLDEDELYEALNVNDITKEQYDNAYLNANIILEKLNGNVPCLVNFCNKYFHMLKEKLYEHKN